MTARPAEKENLSSEENNFKADVMLNDDVLNVSLSGRLDTITAPNLLSIYKQIQTKSTIGSIVINMKDNVREIFETTGFDGILC